MSQRVVVGLSGGVDSSVAAYLLKEAGYEVIAVFMRNWNDERVIINQECPWIDDSNDAMLVADHLGIPFQVVDMSAQYKERIVDYMFKEYQSGRTPNPDVLCNREVKFDLFLQLALQLKADFVATGHYVQKREFIEDGLTTSKIIAGADSNKDQSYFLCQLNQYQLSKALFPIGHLQKSEVRDLARSIGLPTAEKKDSQGLCFIGKVKLPVFLQQVLEVRKGEIREVSSDDSAFQSPTTTWSPELQESPEPWTQSYSYANVKGTCIGEHDGAHFYTIGQRKGLGVGGRSIPLFIVETDPERNIVYVGAGEEHPALNRWGLRIKAHEAHWIVPSEAMQ
ncbi:MAG: tRNA 2-thiouridine(34) synthase MnmA, partial [Flavobacteriales bacterium]